MLSPRTLARRIWRASLLAGAVPALVAGMVIILSLGRFHTFPSEHPALALGIAFAITAFAVLGSIWSVRLGLRVTRGLRRLNEQANAMARGDLSQRVEMPELEPGEGCRDELDQVAKSLNLLSAHLGQQITERDRYEAQMRELNADLERRIDQRTRDLEDAQRQIVQGEKRAALTHLVAGIAHEINNHVNFITSAMNPIAMGHSDVVKAIGAWRDVAKAAPEDMALAIEEARRVEDELELDLIDEEVKLALDQMREGTQRILNIVTNLQTFSHSGHADPVLTDLGDMIRRTVRLMKSRLRSDVEIDIRIGLEEPVACQPNPMGQVISNLLINSAAAVGDDGHIVVESSREGDEVVVTVRDNGCGIASDDLAKIFDPFFTTKDVGQGTGLGLFVCQQILDEHHGTIDVESSPGQGTEVSLRWPMDQSKMEITATEQRHVRV